MENSKRVVWPLGSVIKILKMIRILLGCRGFRRAVDWFLQRSKPNELCADAVPKAMSTHSAIESAANQPCENPLDQYLSTDSDLERWAEERRVVVAPAQPVSRTPTSPSSKPKTKGRSLDDLPLEILIKIWQYVAEMPSWFHVRYRRSLSVMPVSINMNREHGVNKKWYLAPELRVGLCPNLKQARLLKYASTILKDTFNNRDLCGGPLVRKTIDAAQSIVVWNTFDPSCKPFRFPLAGAKCFDGAQRFYTVRPAVDWFFLEDYVDTMAMGMYNLNSTAQFGHLERVSTIVLKLDDLYTGLCHVFNGLVGLQPAEPWRINRTQVNGYLDHMSALFGPMISRHSNLEKCVILVGQLREGVLPSDLQEISVEWAEPEPDFSVETQRNITTSPKVSGHDRAMIRFVHQELEYFDLLQRERRYAWLASPDSQQWLADLENKDTNGCSVWLASADGKRWRETTEDGQAWIETPPGYWWLASIYGSPWLETPKGLEWLDSEAGARFLELPAARLWARIDNDVKAGSMQNYDGPDFRPPRRKLPRKRWFGTDKGRAWIADNCPDYLVPAAPGPPPSDNRLFIHHLVPEWFFKQPPRWEFFRVPDV
ncbi:hypothetical protein F5Y19DRAFT_209498 [Xylariaceae sp. FL1651]|nr:hypothetical protein F5Y19DRAFT_209498 [Xylariaceae sp. FL1651]